MTRPYQAYPGQESNGALLRLWGESCEAGTASEEESNPELRGLDDELELGRSSFVAHVHLWVHLDLGVKNMVKSCMILYMQSWYRL